jgi:hypothetical protein
MEQGELATGNCNHNGAAGLRKLLFSSSFIWTGLVIIVLEQVKGISGDTRNSANMD